MTDNFELGPKFQKQYGLGLDVFYQVRELGPGLFILGTLKLG